MRWFMAVLFVSGAAYLTYSLKTRLAARSALAQAPAAQSARAPRPVLSPAELERVRVSLTDRDAEVRKAAMRLLDAVRDPLILERLGLLADGDPDADVRRLARRLVQDSGSAAVAGLLLGLRDVEPSVRLAALGALGRIGDPSVAPLIAKLAAGDPEPDVRAEAIRALGSFQDQRVREFRALADRLRREYERAVAKKKGG